jgi:hypothetical protein
MKTICEVQLNKASIFVGAEPMVDGTTPFQDIFNDPRYKKSLNSALKLFDNVDTSAVIGGSATGIPTSIVLPAIENLFKSAPNILLEHYLNFLNYMGCTLVIGNERMYVLPLNSVLKQEEYKPSVRQLQKTPNHCGPADYMAYSYNDNGYRDIASVIVSCDFAAGGLHSGDISMDHGMLAQYVDNQISAASGVLVARSHPFMAVCATAPSPKDNKESNQDFTTGDSMLNDIKGMEATASKVKSATAEAEQTKKKGYEKTYKDVIKNYAETKFYQTRYGDRQGSISMDFNPKWVPGTGGTLYIRDTNTIISFYVTAVTHQISLGAPSNGSAMTIVNFSCGRLGETTKGVSSDDYLGYNIGKEQAVQNSFVSDIGAG